MESTYHFGHLVTELEFFSFPRTGAHYFNYCAMGLFDVVALPHADLRHKEAASRQQELNPAALYALRLREQGVPYQPVLLYPFRQRMHSEAVASESKIVLLIRDPIATAYSRYRVEISRWHGISRLQRDWLEGQLTLYRQYYDASFAALESQGRKGLLLRWERMVESPAELEALVAFSGLQPKLRPDFVWQVTQFGNFTKAGERTFYRAGSNEAWRRDAAFVEMLRGLPPVSFARYGYPDLDEQLAGPSLVKLQTAVDDDRRAAIPMPATPVL
jgi:hypothetical protein